MQTTATSHDSPSRPTAVTGPLTSRDSRRTTGQNVPTLSVGDGDELTVNSETSVPSSLDPADHGSSVHVVTGTDDDPVDIGTLVGSEAPDDNS